MKNTGKASGRTSNSPAYPTEKTLGMSLIEFYAAHALQGIIIANPKHSAKEAAAKAVEYGVALADALAARKADEPDEPWIG